MKVVKVVKGKADEAGVETVVVVITSSSKKTFIVMV